MPRGGPAAKAAEPAIIIEPSDNGAGSAETPVRRRRRRRTASAPPDYAGETATLIEATLKSRGPKGATQEALQTVVDWARGVRGEGEELRQLSSRPRRQKTQASADRVTRYDMNRALLEGVLAGTIALDIEDDGGLIFVHGQHSGPSLNVTASAVTGLAAGEETEP